MITVRRVTSRRNRKRFIEYPYSLYQDYPFWVPPLRVEQAETLNPKKNPFFEHGQVELFLATDAQGKIVGRIAAIVNGMHLEKFQDGTGFFGFFECIEEYQVAEALLDAATSWLIDQGLTGVRGPTNPSMNDVSGLLVGGFDRRPAVMMPYNPPYYKDYLIRYGFERAMTMWAYYVSRKHARLDRLFRGADLILRRNPDINVRTLEMKRLNEDAQIIRHIYEAAWADNWGNVPFTEHEFDHLVSNLKQVVDPRLVYIVEKGGEPVAFSITLPDINEALWQIKGGRLLPFGLFRLLTHAKVAGFREVRTLLMGVVPEYQGKGYDALMHAAIFREGPAYGYWGAELSWVLESNPDMMNTAERLGGIKDKEYALFERSLSS